MTTQHYYATPPEISRSHSIFNALILALVLAFAPLVGTAPAQATPDVEQATASVNINQADAQTLADALVGIGLKRAVAIVEYREAYGPFTSIDELEDVKGVGKATIDRNKAVISLD